MAVSNFKVNSSFLSDTQLSIQFTFNNNDVNETGYKFQSFIDSVYAIEGYYDDYRLYEKSIDIRDSELTVLDPTTFSITKTYPIESIPYGKIGQFYLSVYNKLTGNFYNTTKIPYNFPVSPVSNFISYYDGFDFNLTWDKVNEPLVSNYKVEKTSCEKLLGFYIELRDIFNIKFRHSRFVQGKQYIVHDLINGYHWVSTCNNQEELYISNFSLKQSLKFINYNDYQAINFDIYSIEDDKYQQIADIMQSTFVGKITYGYQSDNSFLAFRVTTFGGNLQTPAVVSVARAAVFSQVIPKLYPIYESTDIYSSSPYFNSMRSLIVDENYYYKNTFSLPYKSKSIQDYDTYNIRGFVGLGDIFVDLIINSTIVQTVKTNSIGEFSFEFNTDFKDAEMGFIAYDQNRLQQSYPLTDITLNKVVQYAHLGILSYAFQRIQDEVIQNTFNQFLLRKCSDEVINSYFAPLVGLTRRQDDDLIKFRQQVEFLFPLLHISNSGGTLNLIRLIIEYYVNNDYGISGYELYEHGDFLSTDHDSWVLDKSLITDKSRLGKNKYTYYVSCSPKGFPDRKSAPVTIFCDYRLWDAPDGSYFFDEDLEFDQDNVYFDQQNYYPPLNLIWNAAGKYQDYNYHVYRKVNDGQIFRLTPPGGQDGTGFCDNGSVVGVVDNFPEFGYFDTPVIQNLQFIAGTILYDGFLLDYNPNYFIVIIYEEFEGAVTEGVKDRISTLLTGIAKPEQFFVIKYFPKI